VASPLLCAGDAPCVAAQHTLRDPSCRQARRPSREALPHTHRPEFFDRQAHYRNCPPRFSACQRLDLVPDIANLPGLSEPRFPRTRGYSSPLS
jgi:hypothetical protein